MVLAPFSRTITGICVGFLVLCYGVPNIGAQTAPESKSAQEAPAPTPSKPETETAPSKEPADSPAKAIQALPLKERAWLILRDGVGINNTDKRAKAIKALGLLTGNTEAEKLATAALKDEKGDVRAAAATALGNMHAVRAKPALEAALDDNEPAVVLAAANSLLLLKDADFAYDVYYGVLTGTVRTNKGVVREQIRDQVKMLHDKKKIAQLGLEEGVGFIPYGGLGYGVVKTMVKADNSAVRAAAARKLAHDPDPASAKALVAATQDKNTLVRVAALEAISERGDRSLATKVAPSLDDDKDEVRYTAAACVAHLSALPAKRRATPPSVTSAANPN